MEGSRREPCRAMQGEVELSTMGKRGIKKKVDKI